MSCQMAVQKNFRTLRFAGIGEAIDASLWAVARTVASTPTSRPCERSVSSEITAHTYCCNPRSPLRSRSLDFRSAHMLCVLQTVKVDVLPRKYG